MFEKQKQDVGNNSTAIQANGNITITPYHELRTIFLDLFELNFPRIQQVAKEIADNRIQSFLSELQSSFEKHKEHIDPVKFSEPAIQYEMQAMAIDVARKGDKSNIELLCELFCTIMSKDCPELIELIASEGRRILPMLSSRHVSYLSLEIIVNEASIPGTNLNAIDQSIGETINHIKEAKNTTYSDLQYVACAGAIVQRGITVVGTVPSFFMDIPELKGKNAEQIIEHSKINGLKNLPKLLKLLQRCHIGRFELTAVGRLIGWLNLSKFSQIDIKTLFQ